MAAEAFTLGFVGDIGLGPAVASVVADKGAEAALQPIAEHLRDCDLVVGNLECAIYDGPAEHSRVPGLCAKSDDLEILSRSPIKTLNLANNHVLDLGPSALPAMIERLRSRGFHVFGAGENTIDAEAAHYRSIAGRTIAFLGACDVTDDYATPRRPGIAPMIGSRLCRSVVEAKKRADLVIVSLHADVEFVRFPSPFRRRIAKSLIDAGASLVVQHHPHVCQGVERYADGLIAYSLGNFIFKITGNSYQENVPGVRDGMILKVNVPADLKAGLTFSVLPIRIDDDHMPQPVLGSNAQESREEIASFSEAMAEPGRLRKEWLRICMEEGRRTLYETYYTARRRGLSVAMGRTLHMMKSPEQRRWILGLLTLGVL